MRITIDKRGIPIPADEVQLIRQATGEDGKNRRFFLCLGCRDLIEVEDGQKHVHECEGKQETAP
ncbi:MAG TPA: hypothetical protein VMR52_06815 [Dehalococcoidia bacterium]|nr:hypothetical protein [Dehalococcoidia bacterium]